MLKDAGLVTGGAASVILANGCSDNSKIQDDSNLTKPVVKKSDLQQKLVAYPVHHGGRKLIKHPELNREIYMQTAVCYLRFPRKAKVGYLELPVVNENRYSGRWTPRVPTHPAHVIVSMLDREKNRWVSIKNIDLPANPKFSGEGLSQDMSMDQMEAFFGDAVGDQPPHRIELNGIETDCLKVECDREHPVWPNHGECNGAPYNVPFGMFKELSAFGKQLEKPITPDYRHKLKREKFAPVAPAGMTIETRNPLEIVFRSNKIAVGFSLIRPMLTHLNWDYFGERPLDGNRLLFRSWKDRSLNGVNGPSYITPTGNFVPQNMTGTVEVSGNQVRYLDIQTGCGVTINAVFTVTAEAITLELEQKTDRDIPAIEAESWRLLWNMKTGMTSVAGVPAVKEGRNGFVQMPAMIAADEGGGLSVQLIEGNGIFHAESYRFLEARSTGFVLSNPDTIQKPHVIPKGTFRAVFELKPCTLSPIEVQKEATLSEGIKKHWMAGFSAFRPEFGGFSNNAISTNCHVNQHVAFDFAAFTAKSPVGLDPMDLVKFSIGRALLDGGGYGYHRNLYLDSDPILVSGAGRIVQLTGDQAWLKRVSPGVKAAVERILGNFDAKEGMIVCRALSGNSGSHRWSSNAMDMIGFGHIDAYVNAWSFRALKNAVSLFKILGDRELAARCDETAAAIFDNYARQLVNPQTGWVSGWKSRDGKLHDFGFIWINGAACAFGVMDDADIRLALKNLEAKRQELFPESGYLGLPLNLLPTAETDHMIPKMPFFQFHPFTPTFENFTDGALSPVFMVYYMRALSTHGFKDQSQVIVNAMEQGFADGKFCGPYGTGKEFTAWTGADSGYEGTFGPSFSPLYAIAAERGIITPPTPEWWL
jgi:hypothetical protein